MSVFHIEWGDVEMYLWFKFLPYPLVFCGPKFLASVSVSSELEHEGLYFQGR